MIGSTLKSYRVHCTARRVCRTIYCANNIPFQLTYTYARYAHDWYRAPWNLGRWGVARDVRGRGNSMAIAHNRKSNTPYQFQAR